MGTMKRDMEERMSFKLSKLTKPIFIKNQLCYKNIFKVCVQSELF